MLKKTDNDYTHWHCNNMRSGEIINLWDVGAAMLVPCSIQFNSIQLYLSSVLVTKTLARSYFHRALCWHFTVAWHAGLYSVQKLNSVAKQNKTGVLM